MESLRGLLQWLKRCVNGRKDYNWWVVYRESFRMNEKGGQNGRKRISEAFIMSVLLIRAKRWQELIKGGLKGLGNMTRIVRWAEKADSGRRKSTNEETYRFSLPGHHGNFFFFEVTGSLHRCSWFFHKFLAFVDLRNVYNFRIPTKISTVIHLHKLI